MLMQSKLNGFGLYRNYNTDQTQKQKKALKEGIIVNNFIKGAAFEPNIIIPECIKPIPDLEKNNKKQTATFKFLAPISIASLAVSASLAGLSHALKRTSGLYETNNVLMGVSRYISINDDNVLAIYYACKDRSKKSIMAASVIMIATAFSFVSKNVIDGYKDIWLRKKEADLQKNLQERLIDVETRSFSGKHQITKNILVEGKAKLDEITKCLCFKGTEQKDQTTKTEKTPFYEKNWFYAASLAVTLGVSFLLTKHAYKNICEIDKGANKLSKQALDKIKDYTPLKLIQSLKNNPQIGIDHIIEIFKNNNSKLEQTLNNALKTVDDKTRSELHNLINEGKKDELLAFVEKLLSPENKSKELTQKTTQATVEGLTSNVLNALKEKQESFVKDSNIFAEAPSSYYGYANKAYFSSVVNEATAYLYAMLISPNKATRDLFLSVSAFSSLSYIGTKLVEAIKDFQVKKQNANTEYELHNNLVETELKNFKAKKESIINPMIEEYRSYKKTNPTDTQKLEKMYNNILEEIQNGAPFAYS
ncbi:MAG: hypothetical protein WCK67_06595 [bacterium]